MTPEHVWRITYDGGRVSDREPTAGCPDALVKAAGYCLKRGAARRARDERRAVQAVLAVTLLSLALRLGGLA